MACTGVPRLGMRHERYAAQLGAPVHTGVLAGCVLRGYAWPHGDLGVLFAEGASIAVHWRYPATRGERQALRAVLAACRATDPHTTTVYCDDTGWTYALRSCPCDLIAALHAAMRRPCAPAALRRS